MKNKAKNYAYRLLSRSAKSKKEIIDKLKSKGYNSNIIDEVIKELESYGFIDDYKFAEQWIISRSKYYGKYRLRNELIKKGVSPDIIEELIEKYCPNSYDLVLALAKKWLEKHKNLDKKVAKRRLFNFIARRGVEIDKITEIISSIF